MFVQSNSTVSFLGFVLQVMIKLSVYGIGKQEVSLLFSQDIAIM